MLFLAMLCSNDPKYLSRQGGPVSTHIRRYMVGFRHKEIYGRTLGRKWCTSPLVLGKTVVGDCLWTETPETLTALFTYVLSVGKG